ncbi:hypothetical protein BC826DRAFT_1025299 [Russula brevipes]|nr:hypothetical protein BC826DRAFT_1025299 [Russula brevipes]
MRLRSTLVITFLVPILDILATVGAAPSDFRSRENPGSLPILLTFTSPGVEESVPIGKKLAVAFTMKFDNKHYKHLKPPWLISFSLEQKRHSSDLGSAKFGVPGHDGEAQGFYVVLQEKPGVLSGPAYFRYQYNVSDQGMVQGYGGFSQPFNII